MHAVGVGESFGGDLCTHSALIIWGARQGSMLLTPVELLHVSVVGSNICWKNSNSCSICFLTKEQGGELPTSVFVLPSVEGGATGCICDQ